MKALAAVLFLAVLGAYGSAAAESGTEPAPRPKAGKPSPYAPPPPPMPEEGIVCPADVRPCPDRSFVSRDPANGCAFAPCPGASKQ